MTPLSAICKSQNGEPGNGMRAMMGMRGIRVGMPGIRVGMMGIGVGMLGLGGGNEGNQSENLPIGVEMIHNKCGEK